MHHTHVRMPALFARALPLLALLLSSLQPALCGQSSSLAPPGYGTWLQSTNNSFTTVDLFGSSIPMLQLQFASILQTSTEFTALTCIHPVFYDAYIRMPLSVSGAAQFSVTLAYPSFVAGSAVQKERSVYLDILTSTPRAWAHLGLVNLCNTSSSRIEGSLTIAGVNSVTGAAIPASTVRLVRRWTTQTIPLPCFGGGPPKLNATWTYLALPLEGTVTIPAGKTVILDTFVDLDDLIIYGTVEVMHPSQQMAVLAAKSISVEDGGALHIGNEDCPLLEQSVVIQLESHLKVSSNGSFIVYGASSSFTSWAPLVQTAEGGAPSLCTYAPISEWVVPARVVVASTDFDVSQTEERFAVSITSQTVLGATAHCVNLDEPLQHLHFCNTSTLLGEDDQLLNLSAAIGRQHHQCAEFALLHRRVRIESSSWGGGSLGAYLQMDDPLSALVVLQGVQLASMGNSGFGVPSLVASSSALPGVAPSSTGTGVVLNSALIQNSGGTCMQMKGLGEVSLRDSVCYNTLGTGFHVLNCDSLVAQHNLGLVSFASAVPFSQPLFYVQPGRTAILVSLTENSGVGGRIGAWIDLSRASEPPFLNPNRAHSTPVVILSRNTVHSNWLHGIILGTHDESELPIQLSDSVAYKNADTGFYAAGAVMTLARCSALENRVGVSMLSGTRPRLLPVPTSERNTLTNSLLVGETLNRGLMVSAQDILLGRSTPSLLPYLLAGVSVAGAYPSLFVNNTVHNYIDADAVQGTPWASLDQEAGRGRPAAFFSWIQADLWGSVTTTANTLHETLGTQFLNVDHLVFFHDDLGSSAPINSNAILRDPSGDLTGDKDAVIVNALPHLTPDPSVCRVNRTITLNGYICSARVQKYACIILSEGSLAGEALINLVVSFPVAAGGGVLTLSRTVDPALGVTLLTNATYSVEVRSGSHAQEPESKTRIAWMPAGDWIRLHRPRSTLGPVVRILDNTGTPVNMPWAAGDEESTTPDAVSGSFDRFQDELSLRLWRSPAAENDSIALIGQSLSLTSTCGDGICDIGEFGNGVVCIDCVAGTLRLFFPVPPSRGQVLEFFNISESNAFVEATIVPTESNEYVVTLFSTQFLMYEEILAKIPSSGVVVLPEVTGTTVSGLDGPPTFGGSSNKSKQTTVIVGAVVGSIACALAFVLLAVMMLERKRVRLERAGTFESGMEMQHVSTLSSATDKSGYVDVSGTRRLTEDLPFNSLLPVSSLHAISSVGSVSHHHLSSFDSAVGSSVASAITVEAPMGSTVSLASLEGFLGFTSTPPLERRHSDPSEAFGTLLFALAHSDYRVLKEALWATLGRGAGEQGSSSMSMSPENTVVSDADGNSLVAWAVRMNSAEGVRALVEIGMSVTAVNSIGQEPLHIACLYRCDPSVVHELLKAGGDANAIDFDGCTPFLYACRGAPQPSIEMLLPRADLSRTDSREMTPLMLASMFGQVDTVRMLLAHIETLVDPGTFLNAVDVRGWTALHWATSVGELECLEVLLGQQRLNLCAQNRQGETCLHLACREGSQVIIDALLRSRRQRYDTDLIAMIAYRTTFDVSALEIANSMGYFECAKLIEARDSDLRSKCRHSESPSSSNPEASEAYRSDSSESKKRGRTLDSSTPSPSSASPPAMNVIPAAAKVTVPLEVTTERNKKRRELWHRKRDEEREEAERLKKEVGVLEKEQEKLQQSITSAKNERELILSLLSSR